MHGTANYPADLVQSYARGPRGMSLRTAAERDSGVVLQLGRAGRLSGALRGSRTAPPASRTCPELRARASRQDQRIVAGRHSSFVPRLGRRRNLREASQGSLSHSAAGLSDLAQSDAREPRGEDAGFSKVHSGSGPQLGLRAAPRRAFPDYPAHGAAGFRAGLVQSYAHEPQG
eukprot:12082122-Alexandrium_andersonii.AAC.1